jgi:hypothetical protein
MLRRRPTRLATPTPELLDLIAKYAPIVEIGAGDGLWVRALRDHGADVVGFDLEPRGEGVAPGDHTTAAKHRGSLLAIWPPEGRAVQDWIGAAPWPFVIIVSQSVRIELGTSLSGYEFVEAAQVNGEAKGTSKLHVYRRL